MKLRTNTVLSSRKKLRKTLWGEGGGIHPPPPLVCPRVKRRKYLSQRKKELTSKLTVNLVEKNEKHERRHEHMTVTKNCIA